MSILLVIFVITSALLAEAAFMQAHSLRRRFNYRIPTIQKDDTDVWVGRC